MKIRIASDLPSEIIPRKIVVYKHNQVWKTLGEVNEKLGITLYAHQELSYLTKFSPDETRVVVIDSKTTRTIAIIVITPADPTVSNYSFLPELNGAFIGVG